MLTLSSLIPGTQNALRRARMRAAAWNLACAVTAYYVVRHRSIEAAPLDLQNILRSIEFAIADMDTDDRYLAWLLAAAASTASTDAAAATPGVLAALGHARQVLAACADLLPPPHPESEALP